VAQIRRSHDDASMTLEGNSCLIRGYQIWGRAGKEEACEEKTIPKDPHNGKV
jgi:hypothetical protein